MTYFITFLCLSFSLLPSYYWRIADELAMWQKIRKEWRDRYHLGFLMPSSENCPMFDLISSIHIHPLLLFFFYRLGLGKSAV